MASNLPDTITDFEKKASIITALVLDFNFLNPAHNFSGADIKLLVPSDDHADDIQSALNTKSIRDVLTMFYNASFSSHKDGVSIGLKSKMAVWKIKNMNGGVLLPNLSYEFPGVDESVSKAYSREQRFKALVSRLMSKYTLSSSTPTALGIRSADKRPFADTPCEDLFGSPHDLLSSAMRPPSSSNSNNSSSGIFNGIAYPMNSKSGSSSGLMTKKIKDSPVVINVKSYLKEMTKVSLSEIQNHRDALKDLGLNASVTYSKGKYDEPVPNLNSRIEMAKETTPLLFEFMMSLICAPNFQKDSKTIYDRYDTMIRLMGQNAKNNTVTTTLDMAYAMYGEHRVPQRMIDLINGTSSISTSSSSSSSSCSCSLNSADAPGQQLNNDEILARIVAMVREDVTKNEVGNSKKEGMAATICELILQMRENGHALTPTGVELGLLNNLCGLSNEGQVIFSTRGITCGRSTVKKVLHGLGNSYESFVTNMLKKNHGNKKFKILVIFDNYNILRWLKRICSDMPFTQHAPSISLLVEILSCEEPAEGT
jgi:hypothetical protein